MHPLRTLISLTLFFLVLVGPAHGSASGLQIVAFGTSFTNGKGVFRSNAWPAKLEKNLKAEGLNVQVSNQGEDGDTTRDLKVRLHKVIPDGVSIVLLEYAIGNNRTAGIPFDETVKDVEDMAAALVARNIQVLLIIRAGNPEMIERSTQRFKRVVKQLGMLSIVIEQPPTSLLADGRHPTEEAHTEIAASLVDPVKVLILRTKVEN